MKYLVYITTNLKTS
jgi:hypothetical protein